MNIKASGNNDISLVDTDREIMRLIRENLSDAAADCDFIANFPVAGKKYAHMRECLRIAEKACELAAKYRQDARWLIPGHYLEEVHQRARRWLDPPTVATHKMFTMLSAALRKMHADIARLETRPSGRVGTILPKPQQGPLRQGRPVQVLTPERISAGGVILPQ